MSALTGCSRLQAGIKSLAIPDDLDVAWVKKVYPSHSLTTLITRSKIEDVLKSSCPSCSTRLGPRINTNNAKYIKNILAISDLHCFNGNDALNIFAFSVCIESPNLILAFLKLLRADDPRNDRLPRSVEDFSPEFLRRKVWPKFSEKYPYEPAPLGKEFISRSPNFASHISPPVAKPGSRGAVASESSICNKIKTDIIPNRGTVVDAVSLIFASR
jgi:hypothetical protein